MTMRELRVEDALLYLDQVKVEFGDRPHIYNEFLEIMKTFKTQQIDTPGVIRRVSNLFKGNRRLVLGFNTFLPEGYQIEIPADGPPVAVYRAPGSNVAQVLRESAESQAHSVGQGLNQQPVPPAQPQNQPQPPPAAPHAALPPGQQGLPMHHPPGGMQHARLPADPYAQNGMAGVHGQPPPPPPPPPPPQQVGHQHPHHHPALQQPPPPPQAQPAPPPQQPHPGQPAARPAEPAAQGDGSNGVHHPQGMEQQQQQQANPAPAPLEFDHAINYVTTIKKRFSNEPDIYKKFLEILHTYQKEQRGIKDVLEEVSNLFGDHPDLLKEFTYFLPDAVQAQAKVQLDAAAKEAEARQRAQAKKAIMTTAHGMQRQVAETVRGQKKEVDPSAVVVPFGGTKGRSRDQEDALIQEVKEGIASYDPVRPPRQNAPTVVQSAVKNGRPSCIPLRPRQPRTDEAEFFLKVKNHMQKAELQSDRPGVRRHTPYKEFLKCLHLYGAGIVQRDELFLLLKTLFTYGHSVKSTSVNNQRLSADVNELLHQMEDIMVGRGPFANQESVDKDRKKYGSICSTDWDVEECDNPTPSYFTVPGDFVASDYVTNEGQTADDAFVLKSPLVCIGDREQKSVSIESSDAIRKRRNPYERAMFRAEDERFELDMAIARNAEAMRLMEPIAEETQKLREMEEKDGQPIGRLQYKLKQFALKSCHVNAIARVYGDRGDEVLQHLIRNPLVVTSIVYGRLKQKDLEWRKMKKLLKHKLDVTYASNYEGCMDVLCHFKRKHIDNGATPTRLRDDCKRARTFCRHPDRIPQSKVENPFMCSFQMKHKDVSAYLLQPYCSFAFKADNSQHLLINLIWEQVASDKKISPLLHERIGRVITEFVTPWFGLDVEWVADVALESYSGNLTPNMIKYAVGQCVATSQGSGTVMSLEKSPDETNYQYEVNIAGETVSLGPPAILYSIPSAEGTFIRRDGVMIRDEMPAKQTSGSPLSDKYKIMFGTESVYVFVRLFCLTSEIVLQIKESIMENPVESDPASTYRNDDPPLPLKSAEELSFDSIFADLSKVVAKTMEEMEFVTLGRKASSAKAHLIATLPKLIERCGNALVIMAEEDTVLPLFDRCQTVPCNPQAVHTKCLSVDPNALYRMQYNETIGELCCNYVPKGTSLIMDPKEAENLDFTDEEEEMENVRQMDDNEAVADAEAADLLQANKRARLV